MSLHSSLRQATGKAGELRNVLKRHERLRDLLAQGRFLEGGSVYGLPKTKQVRVKVRKAAKEAAPGAEAPSGGKPAEGAAAAPAAKAASPAGKPSAGSKSPSGDKSAGK